MKGRLNPQRVLAIALMGLACVGLAFSLYWGWQTIFLGPYDLVIYNGRVLDGLGHVPIEADIGIRDGRIVVVGNLWGALTDRVIDAQGQIVAPGFIDVHTHIERNMPGGARPFRAPNFVRQGITTIITGNCGTSVLSVRDLFNRLEQHGTQVNVTTFIGHNTVRRRVMKSDDRGPTQAELEQMKKLVDRAMEDGAIGLSTGLAYVPGRFAQLDEIVQLARVVAAKGGRYVSHIRDEGIEGMEAIQEAIRVGEQVRLPVHISHFKVSGRRQWGTAQDRLDLIAEAQRRRLQVTIDQYPYMASSTGLDILLPPSALAGTVADQRRRLRDPRTRSQIRSEMFSLLRRNGWKDYSFARIAAYSAESSLNGSTIADVSTLRPTRAQTLNGTADNGLVKQADVILDLVTRGGAQMIYFDMSEDDVITIMRNPDTMFGSDSAVRSENMDALPHPRGMGTFPKVLGRYVREQHILSLEEAVRRMTSLPASIFGMSDRGQISEGCWADLVIFNERKILDRATYESPLQPPEGISYVIVNGAVVFEKDHFTKSAPGKVIRHYPRTSGKKTITDWIRSLWPLMITSSHKPVLIWRRK
jgi:N-acyl-D-amino-acid deacylase